MKRIVVHCEQDLIKVAVLENNELVEYFTERSSDRQRVGNIYKGKVMNILPGMQAAFVDIGTERNAFLYIDDCIPVQAVHHPDKKPSITSVLSPGQELLVQVAKEALGNKGARVTTHCSIPGRSLVYMPGADYVGISRKINADRERARLRAIGDSIRKPGEGLIFRTVAEGEGLEALSAELEDLRNIWKSVVAKAEEHSAPSLIYRDLDTVPRIVRDLFTEEVEEIVFDEEDKEREARELLAEMSPGWEKRVKLYRNDLPLFSHYNIYEELNRAFKRKLWLKSGAYLVVEQTEALTVIDVNTGKFTGSVNLENTVYETNLEAAHEIARIVRLRDLSGIIIVDFIDMEEEEHRQQIVRHMEQLFQQDRTRTSVVGWTKLGLLELTRKKVREPLDTAFFTTCSHCKGRGKIFTPDFPLL